MVGFVARVDCFVVFDFVERCLLVASVVHVEGIVIVERVIVNDDLVLLIEYVVLNPVPKKVVKLVLLLAVIACRFLGDV